MTPVPVMSENRAWWPRYGIWCAPSFRSKRSRCHCRRTARRGLWYGARVAAAIRRSDRSVAQVAVWVPAGAAPRAA